MKKTSFILLVLCALLSTINAQTPTSIYGFSLLPNEQTMQSINAGEYIFEGEKIDAKSYYNSDSSKIYTSIKVKVNAIYKGNLTEGEVIELIVEGGTIGLDERVNRHGGPGTGMRSPYILFCKKLAKLPVSNQAYNLPVKISYVNSRSYLVYGEYELKMLGLNNIGFKTKQDVENLLLKVPGVTLPQKKQVEVQVESKPQADTLSIEEFFNQNNLDGKKAKQIMENRKKKTLNQSKSGTLQILSGTSNDFTLTFDNDTIKKYLL
jgi:hypothetical protein